MAADGIDERFERARALALAGDWTSARTLLLEAAERTPDALEVWLWLGAVAEDPAEAVRCLERAVALNPRSRRAQQGLAWARERLAGALEAGTTAPAPAEPTPAESGGLTPLAPVTRPPAEGESATTSPPATPASARRLPRATVPDWGEILDRLRRMDEPAAAIPLASEGAIEDNGERVEAASAEGAGLMAAEEERWEAVVPATWGEAPRATRESGGRQAHWRIVGWGRR